MDESAHDVIVVGCGPAGATAAALLGRAGLDVVAIDKAEFPRPKVCGGALTHKTQAMLERLFGVTAEALEAAGIVKSTHRDYEIRYRRRLLVWGRSRWPFCFVERAAYDQYLLRQAQAAGATLVLGDGAAGCDVEAGTVVTRSGRVFRGRHVIGADGAHSVVRAACPAGVWDRRSWAAGTAMALEVTVPWRGRVAQGHPVIYFGFVKHGYAWSFPNADGVVVGLAGVVGRNRARLGELFERYLDFLGVEDRGRIAGHPVPYGNFLSRPAHGRALLVGDAAGMADPVFGEGIYLAHRTGELAALSVLEAEGSSGSAGGLYVERLEERVLPVLRRYTRYQEVLFKAVRYLPAFLLGMVMRRVEGKVIRHGHDATVWT